MRETNCVKRRESLRWNARAFFFLKARAKKGNIYMPRYAYDKSEKNFFKIDNFFYDKVLKTMPFYDIIHKNMYVGVSCVWGRKEQKLFGWCVRI